MKKVLIFFFSCAMLVGSVCVSYAEDVPLIFLEDSKSSIETEISKYLLKTRSWHFSIRFEKNDPDDAFGRAIFNIERHGKKHKILVVVDTSDYQRVTATKEIVAKRIKFFIVVPDGAMRARNRTKALEWINKWGIAKWAPGKMYLDKDGDIVCEGLIFLGKDAPVHLEQISGHLKLLMDTFCDAMDDAQANGVFR